MTTQTKCIGICGVLFIKIGYQVRHQTIRLAKIDPFYDNCCRFKSHISQERERSLNAEPDIVLPRTTEGISITKCFTPAPKHVSLNLNEPAL